MTEHKALLKNILFTFLYAIITLIMVLHHEAWADEAQVWQLCKHLSIIELFKHLVNEGHPSFFYLINMPFAKLGLPIIVMQIFCWFAIVGSVFLFLKYSPFNGFAKFAVISSAGFLYFLPVIARTYALVPILVFALAMLYTKTKSHPLLFAVLLVILANTHIIMFGFCSILAICFLYKNFIMLPRKLKDKSLIISSGIIFIGLLLVIVQLIGTTSSNSVINFDIQNLFANFIAVICKFFLIGINADWSEFQESFSVNIIDIALIVTSLIIYINLFKIIFQKDKKIFWIVLLSILFQILIYAVSYNYLFVSRIFCAHIILIFGLWLIYRKVENDNAKKRLNILVALFFLLTFLNGVRYCLKDYFLSYSGAKPTAEFVKANIDEENSLLLMDNIPYGISLVYYLEPTHKVYSVVHRTPIKYVVWDESLRHYLSDEGWDKYAKFLLQQNPDLKNKKIYAIISQYQTNKFKIKNPKNFRKIFSNNKNVILVDERYEIFEYLNK